MHNNTGGYISANSAFARNAARSDGLTSLLVSYVKRLWVRLR
jgi:hypothetical protein